MIGLDDIRAARWRIQPHIRKTPILPYGQLSAREEFGGTVTLKLELLQAAGSFKARGLSAAISRARALNASTVFLPTAGNAGNAAAAYAAAAGMRCEVFIPRDAKQPFVDECRLYGANVTLVDGLITDAGRVATETAKPQGWYEVSTFREAGRCEGKKTMGYEVAEQLNWTLPDWIIYPTGGGTGMVGMWKAFDEMERISWLTPGRRPKMVLVQAEHCAPIVRAFEQGAERSEMWQGARTLADGLRVPKAVGDFLVLRAVRESVPATVNVMVDAAVAEGARLVSDWPVRRVEATRTGYRVHGDPNQIGNAQIHAERLVVAAGGWLPTLLEQLPLNETFRASLPRFEVSQENAYHFPYRDGAEGWPTFIHKDAAIQTYSLPGGAFFALRQGRIARVSNWYNLPDWLRQVRT